MLREQTYVGCIKCVDSILVSANNEIHLLTRGRSLREFNLLDALFFR